MKLAFSLVVSVLLVTQCIGQLKIDSLKSRLEIVKKQGHIEDVSSYLSLIGYELIGKGQYDSALNYLYRSLRNSVSDPSTTASSFDCIGVCYNYKGFPDSSVLYYNKALEIYQQLKDTTHSVIAEINLSIIYKNRGLYESALENAFNALAKQEKGKPDRALASTYNTIASVYSKINDYSNALTYYRKALNLRKQIEYRKGVGQSYNNIGEVFIAMHLYDSALSNLMRSAQLKREAGDSNSLATSLNLIGEVYLEQAQYTLAEPYLMEALQTKHNAGERPQEAIILNNLGRLKLRTDNNPLAEGYLNRAETLIHQAGLLDDLRENLELKIELYSKTNPAKALFSAQELLLVKDSLLNKDKAQSLVSMQISYETEKKEQQIVLLEQNKLLQDAELKTRQIWIKALVAIIITALLAAFVVYYQYRQLRASKNNVELLLKELHHRVKNNLQILSSLFSLQASNVTDENAIQVIKGSESRVNAMAIIHKKLYGDEVSRSIDMNEYLAELLQYLSHSYGYDQRNGELNLIGEKINLDVDKAIPLGLITNELVSNALKHAYQHQPHPKLTIQLHQTGNNLEIQIQDNGVGMCQPPDGQSTKSFGLKLVNTLIKELKGTIKTQNHNGTTIQITIPTT